MDTPQEQRMMLEAHRAAWHINVTAWLSGGCIHLSQDPIPPQLLQRIPADDVPASYPY